MRERSRLTRIIRLKERLKDARTGKLAAAEAHERRAADAVRRQEAKVTELAQDITQIRELSARELSGLAGLHARARVERESLTEVREAAEVARAERAAELAESGRELRRFEVLDQRLDARDREVERRREQASLDESARRIARAG